MKDDELEQKNEEELKREERSKKIIELFSSIQGMNVEKFPVPPFTKWLNGKIQSAKKGEVKVEIEIRPEMANPTGLLHGGMVSAMMDDVLGMTCATLGYSGFLITIDFHVDFLGKAKVGENVVVTGKITRDGRNIVHGEAYIHNKDGELISQGSSNLIKTQYKPEYVKAVDKIKKDS